MNAEDDSGCSSESSRERDSFKYDEPEKSSRFTRLKRWNWKIILTIILMSIAYLLCNMCYSIMGPFFPHEVKTILLMGSYYRVIYYYVVACMAMIIKPL